LDGGGDDDDDDDDYNNKYNFLFHYCDKPDILMLFRKKIFV